MKQEHHNSGINTFGKGANTDQEKEFLGAQDRSQYIDSRNMRPTDVDGSSGIARKIKGEELAFPLPTIGSDYVCVGSTMVFDNVICLWASDTVGDIDTITINGLVVAQNDLLAFRTDRPFQIDINESCIGGEFFITDNEEVPRIFNVQDMLDAYNSGSQKYFSDYDPSLYSINLQTSFNVPVFKELYTVGGAGLPVGAYTYSYRYVSADGDVTNWTPETPPISVVQNLDQGNSRWPHATTAGSQPNVASPTNFGIRLKFRVTNFYNYDSIEIRRRSWNSDVGPNFTPQAEIIAQISINPNEVSVRTFDDPDGSNVANEPVDDQEDVETTRAIRTAKAIRYYDRRLVLMNVSYESPDFEPTITNPQDKPNFVVEDIGTDGHKDPWKNTYRKSYQRGEKHSFGIVGYDGLGSPSFAFEPNDYRNVRFPNRRDNTTDFPVNPSTENVNQPLSASDVQRNISDVFEVFDMTNAVSKRNVDDFKNIISDGGKIPSSVFEDSSVDPASVGGTFGGVNWQAPYRPYTPTVVDKSNTEGHDYRVNTAIDARENGPLLKAVEYDYNPRGFAPSYKSLGVSIGSIQDIPSWVKAFAVGRSKRAGRVVAQGLGMYKISEHQSGFADSIVFGAQLETKKDRNVIKFYSNDVDAGFFPSDILTNINQNSPYKVQLVSPLAFFSEVYNFDSNGLFESDRVIDMVSYARIYREDGTINPKTRASNTYDVKYGEWAEAPTLPNWFTVPEGGNRVIDINSVSTVVEGRGTHFELTLGNSIYEDGSPRTSGEDLSNDGTKFLEPWYIVNIILDEEDVPDAGINSYINTGTIIKTDSIIGIGDGGSQTLELVDERWEDCCATIYSSSPVSSTLYEAYVYVEDDDTGVVQKWLDVTDHTPAQVTAIINDISSNGVHVTGGGTNIYGVYVTTRTNDESDVRLIFNNPGSYVPEGARISVRYDTRRPIRVFGGDTVIHESIFAPIDREATAESSDKESQFRLGIGLPYQDYFITPRHYVVKRTTGVNKIQDSAFLGGKKFASLFHIRQWCSVFTAESRVSLPYMYQSSNDIGGNQFYGNTHYVMRPNRFDDDFTSLDDITIFESNNNLHTGYKDDYPGEWNLWKWGGFRFLPAYNQDYMAEGPANIVSKPKFGFVERDAFCTGIVWSLRRATNQQQAPGLRTFPPQNFFVISDRQGPIVRAYDAQGGKGDNLYAITTRGICLLITNKDVLRDANAGEIGYMESEQFIGREYWIEKGIGMDDEMWRLAAEGLASYPGEMGNSRLETLFFASRESVYKLVNNKVYDIGSLDYYSRLRPYLRDATKSLDSGRMAGYYDALNDEYVFQISYKGFLDREPSEEAFAFSQINNSWNGAYDFRFDYYATRDQFVYGARQGEVQKLNEGYIINGNPIESWLKVAFSNAPVDEKEFIRIRVNGDKPEKIEFLDSDDAVMCELSQASKGPLYLKRYDGWEQFIPRKQSSYDVNEFRVQDRLLIYKIIHTFEEAFNVKNVVIQYKILK